MQIEELTYTRAATNFYESHKKLFNYLFHFFHIFDASAVPKVFASPRYMDLREQIVKSSITLYCFFVLKKSIPSSKSCKNALKVDLHSQKSFGGKKIFRKEQTKKLKYFQLLFFSPLENKCDRLNIIFQSDLFSNRKKKS